MTRFGLPWIAILLCMGCSSAQQPIPAVEVLNQGNCKITEMGAALVSFEELAQLRRSTLLSLTTPGLNAAPNLTLVAVSNGPQPTPGYRFELVDAFTNKGIATIRLRWVAPDPGSILPQVISYPCIVVGLERGDFKQLRAVDDHDNLLGTLLIQGEPGPHS